MFVNDYLNHWNEAKEGTEAAKDLLRRAEGPLQEALRIDASIAMAHFADGLIRRVKGDHQGALDAFERAVQLDRISHGRTPSMPINWSWSEGRGRLRRWC